MSSSGRAAQTSWSVFTVSTSLAPPRTTRRRNQTQNSLCARPQSHHQLVENHVQRQGIFAERAHNGFPINLDLAQLIRRLCMVLAHFRG